MAPGQYGNKYHPRLYLVADNDVERDGGVEFALRQAPQLSTISTASAIRASPPITCATFRSEPLSISPDPSANPFEVPADRKSGILMIGMGTGIAPFRALIRTIYEKFGSWDGKVRLFYGAKTGLEMLYMNDENKDLAQYVYQPTFKAFQAISRVRSSMRRWISTRRWSTMPPRFWK